jgi:tetratricopeptide (TPR) repeat protein
MILKRTDRFCQPEESLMNQSKLSQYTSEIERYRRYLAYDPDNSLLWINLADLYHQSGRQAEATECYEKCLEIEPDNHIALSRLANQWITDKAYHKAEAALHNLLKEEPANSILHYNLGITLYAQQCWPEALGAFQEAQQAGYDNANCRGYLTKCLHQNDKLEEALEAANHWLELSPGPDVEGYIALLEMDSGSLPEARKRAESVLEQNPNNQDASAILGFCHLEDQQIDVAEQYFSSILTLNPDNPRGLQGQGLIYLHQHRYEQAITTFEKLNKLSPNHPETMIALGWCYLINGELTAAETIFRQLIALDDDQSEAHGGLACALLYQQKELQAGQEITHALAIDQNCFSAIYAKSILLTTQGTPDQGIELLAERLQSPLQAGGEPLIQSILKLIQQQSLKYGNQNDEQSKP